MAAAHVQGANNTGSGTTVTVDLNGITADNLIVVFLGWNDVGATISTLQSVSDGTSGFTLLDEIDTGSGQRGQIAYLLSANAGNKTITATFDEDTESAIIFAVEYSGGTWSYESDSGGAGVSSSPSSGNISASITDGVIICGNKLFETAATLSSPTIGGNTPTEDAGYSPVGTYHHFFYRLNENISADDAAGTYSQSTTWVWGIAAFSVSGAAGGSVVPIIMQQMRRRRM